MVESTPRCGPATSHHTCRQSCASPYQVAYSTLLLPLPTAFLSPSKTYASACDRGSLCYCVIEADELTTNRPPRFSSLAQRAPRQIRDPFATLRIVPRPVFTYWSGGSVIRAKALQSCARAIEERERKIPEANQRIARRRNIWRTIAGITPTHCLRMSSLPNFDLFRPFS